MAYGIPYSYRFVVIYFSCTVFSLSFAQNTNFELPLKAVNLGNWLVIERWMKPSLFDGIPNNELLDGTQIQLKSTKFQTYFSAENGGGTIIVANRSSASGWETFRLWRINKDTFNFRVFNNQFWRKSTRSTGLVALGNAGEDLEPFQIIVQNGSRTQDGSNISYRVRIKAASGSFVQVTSETVVTTDYNGGSAWDNSNPSVFIMTILSDRNLGGEYQLTNGYGPDKAPQVLRDHWNSYITEEDFSFMSTNGINAVRIPVGWWIAYDPTPPKPFVGGSSQVLDKAFTWAQKYGIKVIIDLHAVQGSQNGYDHSGTRDGYQEWGDSYIPDTVKVIDYLAQRYANRESLIAIELINEPLAPGVTLDSLRNYYKQGYNIVRKYTSNAYVILSNRLGPADPKEFLSFAGGLSRVVIDVHYYNLFSDSFQNTNAQQNIDYIYNQRASALAAITTSNGPLTFVGEWTGEWAVTGGGSMQDRQRFAKAQIDVYGRATFGWAYWAYKNVNNYWSLKWMIQNNYIKLN